MTQDLWSSVENYLNSFLPADPVMDTVLEASAAAGLPPIHVSPMQGRLLMLLARMSGARNILEIGALAGYSTIWLARGVSPEGRVVTLECAPEHAAIARENIARAGFERQVDVRVGVAIETLASLHAEGAGPFDLIFIDADKPPYPDYLKWALALSRPGTVIIADNVVRDGRVADAADPGLDIQGIRRFHEMLAATPGITATTLQTVGGKGYDGFTVIQVSQG